jgi:hypothetical protein
VFALPAAPLAFLLWVSFELARSDSPFHGEGSFVFLIAIMGTTAFTITAFVAHLIAKKSGEG